MPLGKEFKVPKFDRIKANSTQKECPYRQHELPQGYADWFRTIHVYLGVSAHRYTFKPDSDDSKWLFGRLTC